MPRKKTIKINQSSHPGQEKVFPCTDDDPEPLLQANQLPAFAVVPSPDNHDIPENRFDLHHSFEAVQVNAFLSDHNPTLKIKHDKSTKRSSFMREESYT